VDWLHEQENLTNLFSRLPIKRGLDQLLTDPETKKYPESNNPGKADSDITCNIKTVI
jgi:hypothetical protein